MEIEYLEKNRKDADLIKPVIKEITDLAGIRTSVRIIRKAFHTVALEFGLTKENCPSHPSNITYPQLKDLQKQGVRFYGLFLGEEQAGFVAIRAAETGIYNFEKLAVIPEHRHRGYGEELVKFALNYALRSKGQKVSIGIINEHVVLKEWYKGLGSNETGTQKFNHLPFTVGFLEKVL